MKLVLILLFLTIAARAEYRLFTLYISNEKANTIKQINTTLDPVQFTTYYPLANDEKISYVSTWLCKGRTGDFKENCSNPKNQ